MEAQSNSKFGPSIPLDIQSKLVDIWAENFVPEFYETLFLQYVKRLPANEAEITIQQEIRSMLKGSSYIQLFLKAMRDRARLERFIAPGTPSEPQLPQLCQCIGKLRQLNFKSSYYLHKIRSKYQESEDHSIEQYFFHKFAIRLDEFRKQLLKSRLGRIVSWKEEYDPFFISLKTQGTTSPSQEHALEDLFSIPVDDSYRLLKMRRVLVGWIYLGQKKEKKHSQPLFEEKYVAFPSIKKQLIKERSIDIQKIKKTLIYEEEQLDTKSRSQADSYDSIQDKDSNKTRFFRFSPARNHSKYPTPISTHKEAQLLSKTKQDNYFDNLVNRPYHLPFRNERRSEQVGKIRRSRMTQQTNILSRVDKSRDSERECKPTSYKHRLQRLETLPIASPQQSQQSRSQRNRQSTPSRSLSKSLLINIMISPLRTSPKQPVEERKELQQQKIASANLQQRKSPELSQSRQDQVTIAPFNLDKRPSELSKNNISQTQIKNNVLTQQPTSRNIPKSVNKIIETNNQRIKQTHVMGKEENYQNSPKRSSERGLIQLNQRKPQPNVLQSNQSYLKQPPTFKIHNQLSSQPALASNNPINNESIKVSSLYAHPPSTEQHRKIQPVVIQNLSSTLENTSKEKPTTIERSALSNQPVSPTLTSKEQKYSQKSALSKPNVSEKSIKSMQELPSLVNKQQISKIQQQPSSPDKLNSKSQPIKMEQQSNANNLPSQNTQNKIQTILPSKIDSTPNQSYIKQSSVAPPKEIKRQIKIKIGKMSFTDFVNYLNAYSAHPQYSRLYDIKKILKETEVQQTYLTEFIINDQPAALVLSSLVPPANNFAIRLWLPHSTTDLSISPILFRKYIEMVEKQITAPTIYFKGEEIAQLQQNGFQLKKERLYGRQRTTKPREIEREFQPFLSCECSQVSFPQRQKEDMLFSQQIDKFDSKNSLAAQFLFTMHGIPTSLSSLMNVSRGVQSFAEVNRILEEEQMDVYEVNKSITASSINLLRFAFHSIIKDPFTACDGVFKFLGLQIMNDSQRSLHYVNIFKNNGKLYFGQGFQSIQQFSSSLGGQSNKRGSFCVPMFAKNLYGRYQKVKENDKGFYGNWEMSLVWEDEMQGRLKHSIENSRTIACPFLVAIEIEGILLYSMQVKKDDLLY